MNHALLAGLISLGLFSSAQAGLVTSIITPGDLGGLTTVGGNTVYADSANSEKGSASLSALTAYSVFGDENHEGVGFTNIISRWALSDVIFTGATSGSVTFNSHLTADLFGTPNSVAEAALDATVKVTVSLQGYQYPGNLQPYNQSFQLSDGSLTMIDEDISATFLDVPFIVPANGDPNPFNASVQLELITSRNQVSQSNGLETTVDALNSLTFDTNNVFGLDEGVTANVEGFLENNQVIVPEPSSLVMLATIMLAMICYRHRTELYELGRPC
jgi:hypothetical protein